MTRNLLIATVSAIALSTGAAVAGDCGKVDLMQNAAMSVPTGDNVQLAQNDAATEQDGEKTEVKPGEGGGPTEAVGEQVESGDKALEAGQPEVKKEGEAPAAGGAAAPAGNAAAPAGDAAAAGDKTEVKPGEGQGPTEAVGGEAEKSEMQPNDQSEVTQEGDKTKVKPAEGPTPAP